MYLSRIRIKSGPELFRFVKSDLKTIPYAAHQLLWKAFREGPDTERDFLFRQETRSGIPCFYVVSDRPPADRGLFRIETKEYTPQVTAGERLAFSLTANPVVARKADGKKHSAKHDVWMDAKRQAKEAGKNSEEVIACCEEEVKRWLQNRAASLGFSVDSNEIKVDGYFQHQLFQKKKGRPIRFSSIDYQGLLTVTDPERFLQTLYKGIGRSRAFGCGLMLVRRVAQ